ncbi:MAG: (NiFe) hydrogenase maturation protein HypF, partial [Candidatus Moranbacteria bacterium GW2011_GWF1_36_4]
ILALGAESAGNFSVFQNEIIYFSQNFNDLLDEENFKNYKKELRDFLQNNNIKPNIILTDLHPDFKTTQLGIELSKKYKAKHIQIQHHLAHIYSQISNFQFPISKQFSNSNVQIPNLFYGIALDGTGYGTDGKIWGGEVFYLQPYNLQPIRIGHIENQIMIGRELAIREPARMLISVLDKFSNKKEIYNFIKKHYSRNEFELLHNQLRQNFNCIETSSCGRVFDAVSVLLGFCGNERSFKHKASHLLKKNSTTPYKDLKPKIIVKKQAVRSKKQKIFNNQYIIVNEYTKYILNTTHLFKYLIKNLHKNKKRLAATAQLYIAQGLKKIIEKHIEHNIKHKTKDVVLSGGLSKNKIILNYFKNKKSEKFSDNKLQNAIPRDDAGISFGQIIYYLKNSNPKTSK